MMITLQEIYDRNNLYQDQWIKFERLALTAGYRYDEPIPLRQILQWGRECGIPEAWWHGQNQIRTKSENIGIAEYPQTCE